MGRSVGREHAVLAIRNMEDVMTTTAAPLPAQLSAPRRHRSPFSIGIAALVTRSAPRPV